MIKVFDFDQLCVMLMNVEDLTLLEKIRMISKLECNDDLDIISDPSMNSVNPSMNSSDSIDRVIVKDKEEVLLHLEVYEDRVLILYSSEYLK